MFHVGQRVVCVCDDFIGYGSDIALPKKGEVYTIREITLFNFADERAVAALRFIELHNPIQHFADGEICEDAFWIDRFRPLTERKTDISFAHEILHRVFRKQGVDA